VLIETTLGSISTCQRWLSRFKIELQGLGWIAVSIECMLVGSTSRAYAFVASRPIVRQEEPEDLSRVRATTGEDAFPVRISVPEHYGNAKRRNGRRSSLTSSGAQLTVVCLRTGSLLSAKLTCALHLRGAGG
jgi:hypothetical protein